MENKEKDKYEKECVDILVKFLKLKRKTMSPLFEDFLFASAINAKERGSELGKEIIEILKQ